MKNSIRRVLKAARSGKYKQGFAYLCRNDKYCFMGMCCEVYNKAHPKNKLHVFTSVYGVKSYNGKLYSLPELVIEWLGLLVIHRKKDFGTCPNLVALNDTIRKSLPEIADYLEENLEYYFIEKGV